VSDFRHGLKLLTIGIVLSRFIFKHFAWRLVFLYLSLGFVGTQTLFAAHSHENDDEFEQSAPCHVCLIATQQKKLSDDNSDDESGDAILTHSCTQALSAEYVLHPVLQAPSIQASQPFCFHSRAPPATH